jgi:hypothetical protein
MSRCSRALGLVERLAAGIPLDAAEQAHVERCFACRSTIERAQGFDLVLRAAARSLATEAELGFATDPVATPSAAWSTGMGIDRLAFEGLERGRRPWPRIGAVMGAVAAGLAIAVAVIAFTPPGSGPSAPPARRPTVAVVDPAIGRYAVIERRLEELGT